MRISRLAALVANASEADRVEFFRQCGFPTCLELKKVCEVLERQSTRRLALYAGLGLEESLSPHDAAAVLYSKLHPTDMWHELEDLDPVLYKELDLQGKSADLEYWGDVEADDPVLLEVIDTLGGKNVLTSGRYEIVTVPEDIELVFSEEVAHHDQWDFSRYLCVRSAHAWWCPVFEG